MKNKLSIILVLSSGIWIAGCNKNEVPAYSDLDKVHFYERYVQYGAEKRQEQLTYSFATKNSTLKEGTLAIKVRLQGRLSASDRKVRAEIITDSTTAIEGVHYKLNEGIIKANEYDGILPVTFFRTADMQTEIFKLKLRITGSEDLQAGVEEDSYIWVLVSDILLKPANWPSYYGFGDYSPNKYRFVLDVLGIEDFPLASRYQTGYVEGTYTAAELFAFAYQLQEKYQEYRLKYGPIYMDDEVDPKVEISFNN